MVTTALEEDGQERRDLVVPGRARGVLRVPREGRSWPRPELRSGLGRHRPSWDRAPRPTGRPELLARRRASTRPGQQDRDGDRGPTDRTHRSSSCGPSFWIISPSPPTRESACPGTGLGAQPARVHLGPRLHLRGGVSARGSNIDDLALRTCRSSTAGMGPEYTRSVD